MGVGRAGLGGDDLSEHRQRVGSHAGPRSLGEFVEDVRAGHEDAGELGVGPDLDGDPADVQGHRCAGASGHRGDDEDDRWCVVFGLAERGEPAGRVAHLPGGLDGRESLPGALELGVYPGDVGQRQHATDGPQLAGALGDGDVDPPRLTRSPGRDVPEGCITAGLEAGGERVVDELVLPGEGAARDVAPALVDDGAKTVGDALGRQGHVDVDELPAVRDRLDAARGEIGAQLIHEVGDDRAPCAAASDDQHPSHDVSSVSPGARVGAAPGVVGGVAGLTAGPRA